MKDHPSWLTVAILLAIVLAAGVLRWRVLDAPLERDEGEYAYAGKLLLEGVPPYREAYNMKLPGIYAMYSGVLALFGQTPRGIHTGLLVVNGVTILLVFILTRQFFDRFTALAAAACFAFLSISPAVQGVFANAEHFILLPALGGIIVLHCAVTTDRKSLLLLSGLLLGGALVVKQHGAAFVAFGAVYLLVALLVPSPRAWRKVLGRCALFGSAALIPYGVTCLAMFSTGDFENFWFWTFTYARAYATQVPISQAIYPLLGNINTQVLLAPFAWLLAIVGMTALAWDPAARPGRAFVIGFGIFSFLAVCPGFYFRPHYFVLTLPAAAMCIAIGGRSVITLFSPDAPSTRARVVATFVVLACLADGVVRQRRYLIDWSPAQVSVNTYGTRFFDDCLQIADYIRQHTAESDRIAVLGSEPQLFFYADRRSATGYIYTYSLMEPRPHALDMQRAMIREIEASDPEMLVYVNVFHSWARGLGSHQDIFRWFERYRQRYRLAAIFDMEGETTRKLTGQQLSNLSRRPGTSVDIYRR